MRVRYLEKGKAIWSLIPLNASPEKIVDFVVQRNKRLEEALKLVDSVLPPLKKKKSLSP